LGQHNYSPIQLSLLCNFCFGVTVFCWPAYGGVPDHPWFDPALAPASGTLPRATEVGLLPASDQIGGFNVTVPSFGPSFALRKHERARRTHHLRRLGPPRPACLPGGLRFAYCKSCQHSFSGANSYDSGHGGCFWAHYVVTASSETAGGVEDREMTLLWARLKSWWQARAARAAYRRLFEKDMRPRRRAF
jgi:hypothetical protein